MAITLPDDPARADLLAGRPTLWLNPGRRPGAITESGMKASPVRVKEAEAQWRRLAPLLEHCFPELEKSHGAIRSPLIEAGALRDALGYGGAEFGRIFIKADGELPVAGSIKARGGVFEVFSFAEQLAIRDGLIPEGGDILKLAGERARALFARHTIAVGSTGNLGLSVGIAARALHFKAVVHMSDDAKQWKVDRLTRLGVEVVKHKADFTTAVHEARAAAEKDASIYFVDDEKSEYLFYGYSGAASELAHQLEKAGVTVDAWHPLFVYLPCGIGGSPGGTTYGLKAIFGDDAHCFFVEPVQSPCAMAHMMSGAQDLVSVYDIGLTNRTEADGMAVGRMSAFVADVMRPLLSGIFTVEDDDLFRWIVTAWETQELKLEPSATAGFAGPRFIVREAAGRRYQQNAGIGARMKDATHVLWTTGGAFVPDDRFRSFLARGRALSA